MKAQNLFGLSNLMSQYLTYGATKIMIFSGVQPTTADFYSTFNMDSTITKYGTHLLAEIDINTTYEHNPSTKKTLWSMTSEAQEFTHLADGSPSWYIIFSTHYNEMISGGIDSMGLWGDTTKSLILEDFNSGINNQNILKSFVIEIYDVMTTQQNIGA
jgi:hypothetical protein